VPRGRNKLLEDRKRGAGGPPQALQSSGRNHPTGFSQLDWIDATLSTLDLGYERLRAAEHFRDVFLCQTGLLTGFAQACH
jgi:hypothetical protein